MKNKKDILVGVITIIATTGAMIFSLNYTSNAITENAHKNTIPIVINKKDPKFKISKSTTSMHSRYTYDARLY